MPNSIPLRVRLFVHYLGEILGNGYEELNHSILNLNGPSSETELPIDEFGKNMGELNSLIDELSEEDEIHSSVTVLLNSIRSRFVETQANQELSLRDMRRIDETIKIVAQSDWISRNIATELLTVLLNLYNKEYGQLGLQREQQWLYLHRATMAVLGLGNYSIKLDSARKILCINAEGKIVKKDEGGMHPVVNVNGVHYKPDPKPSMYPEFQKPDPICPGYEYAVFTLMQLIAGKQTIAAATNLLNIEYYSETTDPQGNVKPIVEQNLVQAGKTIIGKNLKLIIQLQNLLKTWQKLLDENALVDLLSEGKQQFSNLRKEINELFPELNSHFDNQRDQANAFLEAIESICSKQSDDNKFKDVKEDMARPKYNRQTSFEGFMSFRLRSGVSIDTFQALIGVIHKYPSIMQGQTVSDLLEQLHMIKSLFDIFQKETIPRIIETTSRLLSHYLHKEAASALFVASLLSLFGDGKTDNFIGEFYYDQYGYFEDWKIVGFDNGESLIMPFSRNKKGEYCLDFKNSLIWMPEIMEMEVHKAVRKHIIETSSITQWISWLCLIARRNYEYAAWSKQKSVSKENLDRIDIPVKISSQVLRFIRTQWQKLKRILEENQTITHADLLKQLYPAVHAIYNSFEGDSVLIKEANLYKHFEMRGYYPFEDFMKLDNELMENVQFQCSVDDKKVNVIEVANKQLKNIDWKQLKSIQQWDYVKKVFVLLPNLTVNDLRAASNDYDMQAAIQRWLIEAIQRFSPYVAQKMLDLGAKVNECDETKQTPLHTLCRVYLEYPDIKTLELMLEVLLTHHTCQHQYNSYGTPLHQWMKTTPDPLYLSELQRKMAELMLTKLLEHGGCLEAKDTYRHNTILDETMQKDNDKLYWFCRLVENGAGIHANGKLISDFKHRYSDEDDLQKTIKHVIEKNFSAQWYVRNTERWITDSQEKAWKQYVIKLFANMLFGEHLSPSNLFIYEKEQNPILTYNNLQTVLETPGNLLNLHHQYVSEQILLSMLIQPLGASTSQFILIPLDKINSGKSTINIQYRLISTVVRYALFEESMNVSEDICNLENRCVLFCLNEMRKPIHSVVRERVLALNLNPKEFFSSWLTDIIAHEERFNMCKELSVFRENAIEDLFEMFSVMGQHLELNPMITHLQLLKKMRPVLGYCYEKVFKDFSSSTQVLARIDAIGREFSSIDINTCTVDLSATQAQFVRTQSERNFQGNYCNPKLALKKIERFTFRKNNYTKVFEQLYEGDKAFINSLALNEWNMFIFNQIDYSKLDHETQKLILTLIKANKAVIRLKIKNCSAISDNDISEIFKSSKCIRELTLINCPKLTDKTIHHIAPYSSNLEKLTCSQMMFSVISSTENREKMSYSSENSQAFSCLNEIRIENNPNLSTVILQSPVLRRIYAKGNKLLKQFTLISKRIDLIDIRDCSSLNDEQIFNIVGFADKMPKLYLECCSSIQEKILHHVSLHFVDWFPKYSFIEWQETIKRFSCLFKNESVDFELQSFTKNELKIMMMLLCHNDKVKYLNLSGVGLDDDDIKHLAEMIKRNNVLKQVFLCCNRIHSEGAYQLIEAMKYNTSLSKLDVNLNPIDPNLMRILHSLLPIKTLGFLSFINSFAHYDNDRETIDLSTQLNVSIEKLTLLLYQSPKATRVIWSQKSYKPDNDVNLSLIDAKNVNTACKLNENTVVISAGASIAFLTYQKDILKQSVCKVSSKITTMHVFKNKKIAVGCSDGQVVVFDQKMNKTKLQSLQKNVPVTSIVANGNMLIYGYENGRVANYDIKTKISKTIVNDNDYSIVSLHSLGKNRIAIFKRHLSNPRSVLYFYDMNNGTITQTLSVDDNLAEVIALKNNRLAVISFNKKITIINKSGQVDKIVNTNVNGVITAFLELTDNRVVLASIGSLLIWNINTNECEKAIKLSKTHIIKSLIQPDENLLLLGAQSGHVTVLNLITNKIIVDYYEHPTSIIKFIQLANQTIYSFSLDGKVKQWSSMPGKQSYNIKQTRDWQAFVKISYKDNQIILDIDELAIHTFKKIRSFILWAISQYALNKSTYSIEINESNQLIALCPSTLDAEKLFACLQGLFYSGIEQLSRDQLTNNQLESLKLPKESHSESLFQKTKKTKSFTELSGIGPFHISQERDRKRKQLLENTSGKAWKTSSPGESTTKTNLRNIFLENQLATEVKIAKQIIALISERMVQVNDHEEILTKGTLVILVSKIYIEQNNQSPKPQKFIPAKKSMAELNTRTSTFGALPSKAKRSSSFISGIGTARKASLQTTTGVTVLRHASSADLSSSFGSHRNEKTACSNQIESIRECLLTVFQNLTPFINYKLHELKKSCSDDALSDDLTQVFHNAAFMSTISYKEILKSQLKEIFIHALKSLAYDDNYTIDSRALNYDDFKLDNFLEKCYLIKNMNENENIFMLQQHVKTSFQQCIEKLNSDLQSSDFIDIDLSDTENIFNYKPFEKFIKSLMKNILINPEKINTFMQAIEEPLTNYSRMELICYKDYLQSPFSLAVNCYYKDDVLSNVMISIDKVLASELSSDEENSEIPTRSN